MRVLVRVKPQSKHESVLQVDAASFFSVFQLSGKYERCFLVCVRAPAREGKANDAVLKLLGEYFHVPLSRIRIASGAKSKEKLIEIDL